MIGLAIMIGLNQGERHLRTLEPGLSRTLIIPGDYIQDLTVPDRSFSGYTEASLSERFGGLWQVEVLRNVVDMDLRATFTRANRWMPLVRRPSVEARSLYSSSPAAPPDIIPPEVTRYRDSDVFEFALAWDITVPEAETAYPRVHGLTGRERGQVIANVLRELEQRRWQDVHRRNSTPTPPDVMRRAADSTPPPQSPAAHAPRPEDREEQFAPIGSRQLIIRVIDEAPQPVIAPAAARVRRVME